MSIEYLVILSYGAAGLLLMTLIGGIGVVTILRRLRLEQLEIAAASHPDALRQKLYMVRNPLDDIQTWSSRPAQTAAKNTVQSLPNPVVLPLRYQQTLLYADNPTNPQNEIETKPISHLP